MLLIAAAIIALLVSLFQYKAKAKRSLLRKFLFAFLRFLTVFTLLVLLINPKITSSKTTELKPKLIIATDNSRSIDYKKEGENVKQLLAELQSDVELQERFDFETYTFGNQFQDSIVNFSESQTKITEALTQIQQLHRKSNTAITLLTDGNQTYGGNYKYYKSKYNQPIYAVAFGDTISYADLSIAKVNANKYAYLGNEFPVEVIVNYKGNAEVKKQLTIKNRGKLIHKELLTFSTSQKSHFVSTLLKADNAGVSNYSISISALESERYVKNNTSTISIDVIDQKQDVLLISEIKHPDIAAINRIVSTNKRNTFRIVKPNQVSELAEYELVIVYQPKSSFKKALELINQQQIPSLIITGKNTDWNFLNTLNLGVSKETTNQTEEILPVIAEGFEYFNIDDFDVSKFPPLETVFGNVTLDGGNHQSLLYKNIAGENTTQPLLSFLDHKAFLQGEGIWKWRLKDYKDHQSFENIDRMFQKVFQFLANKKAKQRLLLDYERINYTNSPVKIQASYFNKSFEFDGKKRLSASLKNKITGDKFNQPFVLKSNYYELDASNLTQGEYSFSVSVSGTEVQKRGYFSIIDFDIENQFYTPNTQDLGSLTENNEGELFYTNQFEGLKLALLQNENLKPLQKITTKKVDLIDWKYLLGLLIGLLALEWFLRKYSGLV